MWSAPVAIVALLAVLGAVDASSRKFDTHPHIQCSACKAVVGEIGKKMNESARIRRSYKKGHRLTLDNKVNYEDYESSELRAIEIMETICTKTLDGYQLRRGADGVRTLTTDTGMKHADFYGRADREPLENVVPRLKDFCHWLLDEHDEAVVRAIKVERQLDALVDSVCEKASRVCGTAKVDKARKAEMAKFEKAEAKRKAAEEKRRQEEAEEAAAKKTKEEEAKAAEAEEATMASGDDGEAPAAGAAAANATNAEEDAAAPSAPVDATPEL